MLEDDQSEPPRRTWKHRTLSVDPETRTGVCAECGPTAMVWRISRTKRSGGRWSCVTGRREQRHRPPAAPRDPSLPPPAPPLLRLDHCETCRIKPAPRARIILRKREGLTLCANCRVLMRADRELFLASLPDDAREHHARWLENHPPPS